MNTDTGRIYELGSETVAFFEPPITAAEERGADELRAEMRDKLADLSGDDHDAVRDALLGETIVPVSPVVAQKMKIGDREFRRRQRRRKARRS